MEQHVSPATLLTGEDSVGLHLMRQAQLCHSGASPSSAQQQQNRGQITRSPSWSSWMLAPASPSFQALIGTRSISVSGNVEDDSASSPDAHAHVDAQLSTNQSPLALQLSSHATLNMSYEDTTPPASVAHHDLPATHTGVDVAPPSPYSPAAESPVRQASQLQVPQRPNCVPKSTRFTEAICRMVEAEQHSALHGKPSTTPMRRLFPQEQAVGSDELPSNPRIVTNMFGLTQGLNRHSSSTFNNLTNSHSLFGRNDDFYQYGTHHSSMQYMWNQEDISDEAVHGSSSADGVLAARLTTELSHQDLGYQMAAVSAPQYPTTSVQSILQLAAHAPLEMPDSVRRCISSVEANGHTLGVCPDLLNLPGWVPKKPHD